jgi:outer membrane protein assembly factor BamD
MISRRIGLVLALALATLACGGRSGPTAVDYSVSAQKNYDRGMEMLERREWEAAGKYFGFIRSRFPYSKFAVLAELRLAGSLFGAEQYLDAAELQGLRQLHVTHELVASSYTSLRIAEAY